jgi:hypothetical protein
MLKRNSRVSAGDTVVLPSQDAPAAISEIFPYLELCIFSKSMNYGFF